MASKSRCLCLCIIIMGFLSVNGQNNVLGAYEMEADGNKAIMLVTPEYYSIAIFELGDHSFVGTEGGRWKEVGDNAVEVVREYNTLDTGTVGDREQIPVNFGENNLTIDNQVWDQIDTGEPGQLGGAWIITGRKRDGEITRRTPGERKTMKILSGTRFQWIAYHIGTKAFSGTGGGIYKTIDGKYVETIDFFSRDKSRVGAELPFDFELSEGEWHHSGLSSKGAAIYEIWSPRPLK